MFVGVILSVVYLVMLAVVAYYGYREHQRFMDEFFEEQWRKRGGTK